MHLLIVEISQKQAYIFSSNKLQDNVLNSAMIAWVTSSEYFSFVCGEYYDENTNLVYAGGGHTVLSFVTRDKAVRFNRRFSRQLLMDFPKMELFTRIMEYVDDQAPGWNLQELTKELERKKALRETSFHQGTFGFEKIDRNTFEPLIVEQGGGTTVRLPETEWVIDADLTPEGYHNVKRFEDLGGSKGQTNFIAVVHIDGNGMGARVSTLYDVLDEQKLSWEQYKKQIRLFSESIDQDFKDAYKEMLQEVVKRMENGELRSLSIGEHRLPIRRIITSGDDICFVAEGRIGLEAARIFVEKLCDKTNAVDGKPYAACAGIAIVHTKYPFFRAYDLAEMLCSNAKRYGARLSPQDNGSGISSIDWHIEYGEIKDTVEEIREEYRNMEGDSLCGRPYVLQGGNDLRKAYVPYSEFTRTLNGLMDSQKAVARTKIKELRTVLKSTEAEVRYFAEFYHMSRLLDDTIRRDTLFDAIEIMDVYAGSGKGSE